MGSAKAAVLPEPVSAIPIRSRFWRASGMEASWIGVGVVKPRFVHASARESIMPKSWNVFVDFVAMDGGVVFSGD